MGVLVPAGRLGVSAESRRDNGRLGPVRPGGRIANIGVHGKPVTLHLERLWDRDVTIATGLVDAYSTPTLLRLLNSHHLDAQRFITHHFGFDDVFARANETGALKVIISHEG